MENTESESSDEEDEAYGGRHKRSKKGRPTKRKRSRFGLLSLLFTTRHAVPDSDVTVDELDEEDQRAIREATRVSSRAAKQTVNYHDEYSEDEEEEAKARAPPRRRQSEDEAASESEGDYAPARRPAPPRQKASRKSATSKKYRDESTSEESALDSEEEEEEDFAYPSVGNHTCIRLSEAKD